MITEPQLKYILALFDKLNWSQGYGLERCGHTIRRVASLTDLKKNEASQFIEYLRELA